MRSTQLLQKIFIKARQNLDKRLAKILFEAAECLSKYKRLSISGIGRNLSRKA